MRSLSKSPLDDCADRVNRRRQVLVIGGLGLCGLAVTVPVFAQQPKVFRVGVLATDSLETRGPFVAVFIEAMRELGYHEQKNISYEPRYANGEIPRLSALATELAAADLDVIVVPNGVAVDAVVRAAEQAKRSVPIVVTAWGNPVGTGRVASLARPGGNATGLTNITVELEAKQLHLLRQAFPKSSRLAVFIDSNTPGHHAREQAREPIIKELGLQTLTVEVKGSDDVDRNVALLRRWGADSIFVENAPSTFNNRKLLVQIAELTRLPAIYGNDVYTDIGGLMSYGSDDKWRWRRAATFVDKILKGARPGDLPIERPTQLNLVINLRTAKALGVTIPQSILLQADRVIE
jgi:putative ABC transport system substrate-binding protein